MRYLVAAAAVAACLSGCGLSVKAGPLNAAAGVDDQVGASVRVVNSEGKDIFGVDLRAAVDGVIGLVTGAINSLGGES